MDGEGALEEQNAAEVTSEELDGGCVGAAGTEHLLLYCLSPSFPLPTPQKISGTNFFNFAYLFLGRCTPLLFLS